MHTKFLLVITCIFCNFLYSAEVGLLITATGRYIDFVPPLIASARKHFCPNHKVTFFVFTDGKLQEAEDTLSFFQSRMGWPFDTMMRYHVYLKQEETLLKQDYLFAVDADMLFVDLVGDEILGKRVATLHPGFVYQRGSYETSPLSTAYVSDFEGDYYFAGGFYGGEAEEVMEICRTNARHIDTDLAKGIIAVWHDESHWNRYCIDHEPTLILNPSYCYPESWDLPYTKKLLALDKNHKEYRE